MRDTVVHMVYRTNSLINDERSIKEIETLEQAGITSHSFVSEHANESKQLTLGKNQQATCFQLLTYKLLGRLSAIELMIRWMLKIKQTSDGKKRILWIKDPVMFTTVPFALVLKKLRVIEKIIWDHHELPPQQFSNNALLSKLMGYLAKKVDVNIQANEWRKRYFLKHFMNVSETAESNIVVIRNFPNKINVNVEEPLNAEELSKQPFIYVQNGFGEHRHFSSLYNSLKQSASIPIVFSGQCPDDVNFDDFPVTVHTVGKVPPAQLPWLFKHAAFTIILYRSDYSVNNDLCDPTRLFHSVANDLPAIVGSNPTMKDVIERTQLGLVLNDDGSSELGLAKAIKEMTETYSQYKSDHSYDVSWEGQTNLILDLVKLDGTH